MADRSGKLDMPHALAAHLAARHLNSAAVADDTLELYLLIASAVALPVLDRPEDSLAEQTVPLRLERPVVDGLGLADLPTRPVPDLIRRGYANTDFLESSGIGHILVSSGLIRTICDLRLWAARSGSSVSGYSSSDSRRSISRSRSSATDTLRQRL